MSDKTGRVSNMSNMIVAPQPLAVEEGAKVLKKGGNAVDAAVTCAFVQSVVSPQMCGIGGYLILTFGQAPHRPGQSGRGRGAPGQSEPAPKKSGPVCHALDAPALAGSRVAPDMWENVVIRPQPIGWGYFLQGKVNDVGYQSICVPGTVRGLATILERWGTITWPQAIAPAARIAEDGFMVDGDLDYGWKEKALYPEAVSLLDRIRANAEASRIYLRGGAPYQAGEILRNPDYARSLLRLAEHGEDDFYHGELARRMTEDLAANGSFVTADDLARYQVREPHPLVGSYREYTVFTSPPPHGGPTLLATLNILEGYDLPSLGHNSPDYIYLVAMAMKAAFADRNRHLGDPEYAQMPVEKLEHMISKERAQEWRERIDKGRDIVVAFVSPESPNTTHVSVVDGQGNCVALTHSLGHSSGVITPGLGFMYNNSMVNFHPWPGHPNSIAPHKSRTTGMTPTIVCKHGRPFLIIGAPGGTRIITALVQVILNVLDFRMSASDAVLAPRFDCQGDLIRCQARIPEYVCAQVRKKHPIQRLPQSHGGLALAHVITIDPLTGKLSGGADTGSGGMPLEV